jgi:hypothetical protein
MQGAELFGITVIQLGDIGGFGNSASSITVTGSNGLFQSLSAVGSNSIAGLANITYVTFNIDQDGGSQTVGLNGLTVNDSVVPLPAALPLLMSALGFFDFLGWRGKKAVAA